ncbi:alpha/beta fold hydrolase [Mycobacterium sp. ML4]
MTDDGVRYARNGGVRLAYRIFGESGPTLIWVPGWVVSNVDAIDETRQPLPRVSHTGDSVFALFDAPTKAARCGLQLVPAVAARNIPIRAGIHTGECRAARR